MSKKMDWLENKFAPSMNRFASNIWIVSLKDTINQIMPLIFLGSIFNVLALPSEMFHWSWWPNFYTPSAWTIGMISILVAFLLPFNLMEKIRLRRSRIIAGISGLILYAITITPQLVADKSIGFGNAVFGAGGMFAAIITGVITGTVFKMFGKFSFFKEDSAIPDFVRTWFDQMLPSFAIVAGGWLLIDILNFDLYNAIAIVLSPLSKFGGSFFGFFTLHMLSCILYSMGISTHVLSPITRPLMMTFIAANIAVGAKYVYTAPFISAYVGIGGAGATLMLNVLMLRSKSKQIKALGRATIIPSLFNINEPLVFGSIVWNPIMMIGMSVVYAVVLVLTYTFTVVIPIGVIPQINFELWYLPFPITTFFATKGSLLSVLLIIAIIIITLFVWYPFFKIYENQSLKEEEKQEAN